MQGVDGLNQLGGLRGLWMWALCLGAAEEDPEEHLPCGSHSHMEKESGILRNILEWLELRSQKITGW